MKNIKLALVNEKDEVVGYKEKFATHKHPVPLHRAVSVVIFDTSGKNIMLGKRAKINPLGRCTGQIHVAPTLS